MADPHSLIERLALDHRDHMKWLQSRFHGMVAVEDLEDVLQGAYARGFAALKAGGHDSPEFETYDKARAWLRKIATNLIADDDRHLHGRRPEERAARPYLIDLDTPNGPLPIRDHAVDIEADVLAKVEHDELQPVVLRALESLAEDHQQVLKLRYGDNLTPAAIQHLLSLTARQWDGRHTRALAAFAKALSKLNMTFDCGQARLHIKHNPQALLDATTVSVARDHVDSCLACQAFARSTRSALAVLPLPVPLLAWKLDTLQYFTRTSDTTSASTTPSTSVFASLKAAAAHNAVVLTATALTAVTGTAAGAVLLKDPVSSGPRSAKTAATSKPATWSQHSTPRQALERAARESARRRAQARARADTTTRTP